MPFLLSFICILGSSAGIILVLLAFFLRGSRHGEEILFAVSGLACFIVAGSAMALKIMLRKGVRNARTRGDDAVPVRGTGAWALAVAFAAIAGTGAYILFSWPAAEALPVGRIPLRAVTASSPGIRTPVQDAAVSRVPEDGDRVFSEVDRDDFLRALAVKAPDSLGSFNLFEERRYFTRSTYSGPVPDQEGEPAPFSCRQDIQRGLAPGWVGMEMRPSPQSLWSLEGVFGDSLFRSFRCREFPDSGSVYLAVPDTSARLARWKALRPGYRIGFGYSANAPGGVSGHFRFDIFPLPDGSPTGPEQPEDGTALFMASILAPRAGEFPFAHLAWDGEPPDHSFETDSVIDLRGYDTTRIGRIWFESSLGRIRTDDGYRTAAVRVVLKCRIRDGEDLILAVSERPSHLSAGDAGFRSVVATDVNGDAEPDFLIQGAHLPERLILTRKGSIAADLLLAPLFPNEGC